MQRKRLRNLPEIVVALTVQVVALLPILRTSYLGDDTFNSAFRGSAELNDTNWLSVVWQIARPWFYEQGRFFPLAGVQTYGQFTYLPSLTAYKVLLIVWIVVSTIAVIALVRRLGGSAAAGGLVAVVATLTMQIRYYHDPLISYAGLQQAVLAYMAVSALLFDVWLRDRRWWALAGSLSLIAVATLTYESAPLLVGLHVVVAIAERGRVRGATAAWPAVALGAAFLAFASYLRSQASAPGAYEAVLDPAKVFPSLGEQLLGTVPLTYVGFNPGNYFLYRGDSILGSMGAGSVLVGLAFAACSWWLVRRFVGEPSGRPWSAALAAALGAVLLLAPAAPIALASRYQAELVAGIAYIPVYIQGFGLALLVVAGVSVLHRWLPARAFSIGLIVLAVGVGGVAAVTHRANTVVADRLQPDKRARFMLEHAVRSEVLGGARKGARLYAGYAAPAWITTSFVKTYGRQRFSEVIPVTSAEGVDTRDPRSRGAYFFGMAPGVAFGGAIDGSRGTRVYLDGGTGAARVVLPLRQPEAAFVVTDRAARVIRDLPAGIRPQEVAVLPLAGDLPSVLGVDGCGGLEGQGAGAFHWCEHTGALAIVNSDAERRPVTLTMSVATAGPAAARVVATGPRARATVRAGSEPRSLRLGLTLEPRSVTLVRLRTDGRRVRAPGDPRRLYLRVIAPTVTPR